MNDPLLLTSIGLLFALVAIERLAAHALRADSARWHAHYARIPANATIMADLRWKEGTWITAFLEEDLEQTGSLQIVAMRPLSPREQSTCLHWLRAEGFGEVDYCGVPPHREQRPSFDA